MTAPPFTEWGGVLQFYDHRQKGSPMVLCGELDVDHSLA